MVPQPFAFWDAAISIDSLFFLDFLFETKSSWIFRHQFEGGIYLSRDTFHLRCFFFDRMFVRKSSHSIWLIVAFFFLLIPGFATWVADAFNSQDIQNRRFTTLITSGDAEVFDWMRQNITPRSIVQTVPAKGGFLQEFVTEIPPFAERSVYLGDRNFSRIFQIPKPVVDQRSRIVQRLFNQESPEQMSQDCKSLGIDFVFRGSKVASVNTDQLLIEPFFTIVNRSGDSVLFRVNGGNAVSSQR